jgi:hypothetical protein
LGMVHGPAPPWQKSKGAPVRGGGEKRSREGGPARDAWNTKNAREAAPAGASLGEEAGKSEGASLDCIGRI